MKTHNERPWAKWVAIAGLLLVLGATALPLLRVQGDAFKWIYTAGAAAVLIGRLFTVCPVDDLRVRRLYRLDMWSGIIFCVGVFFIFYPGAGPTDWVAFTLAGAFLAGYASVMIPRAMARAKGGK